jgi:hypothetical protein
MKTSNFLEHGDENGFDLHFSKSLTFSVMEDSWFFIFTSVNNITFVICFGDPRVKNFKSSSDI